MTPSVRERRGLLAIVLAACAPYVQTLWAEQTLDDLHTVLLHPGVQGPLSLRALSSRDFWGMEFHDPETVGTFRPIASLTYWLDVHLSRGSFVWLHASNLLWFALVLVLAHRALRRVFGDALGEADRLFAIALFASLGVHVEVVASITGRAEMVAMAASLGALDLAAGALSTGAIVGSTLLAAAAVLAKESALPFVFAGPWIAWRLDRAPKKRVLALAGAGALVAAAIVGFRAGRLPFSMHGQTWEIANPLLVMPEKRPLGVLDVFAHYLGHTAAPIDLCPDYGYAALVPTLGVGVVLGLLVALAMVGVFVRTFRRAPRVADAIALFFASYVVISHLLVPGVVILADRNFFHPSLWIVVLVVLGARAAIDARPRLRLPLAAAGGAAIGVQLLLTTLAVPPWRNNRALSEYAVRACPTAMRMHVFRGEHRHAWHDHEETAWSFLVAAAIVERFPRPVDEASLPPEWLVQPPRQRVLSLRNALGPVRFARARALALDALERKNYAEAIALLRGW